jgi:hypothetical protein
MTVYHITAVFRYTTVMKRAFVLILLITLLVSLSASVSPVSSSIGTVAVEIKKGSSEEIVWKAVREEYTDAWLEKYAVSPLSFALAYSDTLSSLLPLSDYLVSTETNGEVKVLDRLSEKVITFIMKEGGIAALSVE